MAQLRDLLAQKNTETDFVVIGLMAALCIEPKHAKFLRKKYVNGYVFGKTYECVNGKKYEKVLAYPDEKRHREMLIRLCGKCVIISASDKVFVQSRDGIKSIAEIKELQLRKECVLEQKAIIADIEKRKEDVRLKKFFAEGQTKPSPKRGGTGKNLGELGKYVGRPRVDIYHDNPGKVRNINTFRVVM